MIETAYTYYFEEIFPDYDTWQQFIENNCNIVNYTVPEQATFDKFCYNILARHFTHCNIRYTDQMAFLGELLNVYQNKFQQFLKEKQIIDDISALTLDELQLVSQTLTNMANNPNDTVEDPTAPLSYISAQTFNLTKSNKLNAYLNALNGIPSLNVYKFIKENNPDEMGFGDLFMNVQPNIKYLYERGE